MRAFQKIFLFLVLVYLLQPSNVKSQSSREIIKTKIGKISFDKAITGFQFATIMKERFIYSSNGVKDLSNPNPTTGFFIEVHENMDYESAVSYVIQLCHQFGMSNLEKMNSSLKDTIINIQGYKSFCSSFSVYDKNNKKTNSMLIGVIPVGNKTVLFLSNDYSNDKYKNKFFKTFESIRT